ncbi:MAG: DUF3721 domain-containing protein [Prochlorococcaceae cyanobacterium]
MGHSLCGAAAVLAATDPAAQGGTLAKFATKAEAEAAGKHFNCKGVHAMGSLWMPCQEHPGP